MRNIKKAKRTQIKKQAREQKNAKEKSKELICIYI